MINSNNFLGYKKLHVPSQYDASNPTERSRSVLVVRSVGGNDIIVVVPRPNFEPQDWLPNLQIPGQFPIPKKKKSDVESSWSTVMTNSIFRSSVAHSAYWVATSQKN